VKKKRLSAEERRSIAWVTIERLAFRPTGDNEVNTWLSLYGRTMHHLFQLDPGNVKAAHGTSFSVLPLNLICKYQHQQGGDKYEAAIQVTGDEEELLWTIHVDPITASKAALHSEHRSFPKQEIGHLKGDIEGVLDGMLFHPRNHTHLEDCGLKGCTLGGEGLKPHEIRISGAIENLFVFLFHLRYQLCLVSVETRAREKRRLTDLFKLSITQNRRVPAKELFDFNSQSQKR
jgi:hypothetical protein